MNVIALLLSLIILASYPVCASASFYRYYDESGGVNVTNDLKSVPERYRATVTVVTEKELENKAKAREREERRENSRAAQRQSQQPQKSSPVQSITTEPSPTPPAEQRGTASVPDKNSSSWLSRQLPLLKVMGIIALLVGGFVVVGRIATAVAPRSLAIIIKIAMLAAIGVFVTKGFSEKIADAFARIKEESSVAQKAVDKRSEKLQQQAE
jgi:hypothetical protein